MRRPVTGRLGVYIFLPFGRCVKGIVRVAARVRNALRVIDYADDLRLVEVDGDGTQLFRGM